MQEYSLAVCLVLWPYPKADILQNIQLEYHKNGLRLLVIWQDQWLHQSTIVKSRIEALLQKSTRIFARKTSISKLTNEEARMFFEKNHLQGWVRGKYIYVLQYQNEVVAVASFSAGRRMQSPEGISYELLRFASKQHVTVVGGLDKLLKHFIKIHQPTDIMTYVDKAWSKGIAFLNRGFEKRAELGPQINFMDRDTLTRYSKHQAKNLNNLVEVENIGSIKLVKKI